MKRILRYRVIWEDGANINFVGAKAVSIETPSYLTAIIEFQRNNLPFGDRRLECDIEEDGKIETVILYREEAIPCSGEIRYNVEDPATGWFLKEFDDYKRLRNHSLDYIWKFIKGNQGDYDSFKDDVIPCLVASRFEKKVRRYLVGDGFDLNTDVVGFNSIDEVIQYVKDRPFGVYVSRCVALPESYAVFYTEEHRQEDSDFYSLNIHTAKAISRLEDEDGFYEEDIVNLYEPEPLHFKNLNELRTYALSHLGEILGLSDWDATGSQYEVYGHKLVTLDELEEEEEW